MSRTFQSSLIGFSVGIFLTLVALFSFFRIDFRTQHYSADVNKSEAHQTQLSAASSSVSKLQTAAPTGIVTEPSEAPDLIAGVCSGSKRDWSAFLDAANPDESNVINHASDLESLTDFIAADVQNLEAAIQTILSEPFSDRRSVLIAAVEGLPDKQLSVVGEALFNSSRADDRIASLTLTGARNADILPNLIERTLLEEGNPQVLQVALQWAANINDASPALSTVKTSVEHLAFHSTDNAIKGEALTAMLSWDSDHPVVLDRVSQILTSTDQAEKDVALYAMALSQAGEVGSSAFWQDIKSSLDSMVRDDRVPIDSRLQSLHVLRDLEKSDEG